MRKSFRRALATAGAVLIMFAAAAFLLSPAAQAAEKAERTAVTAAAPEEEDVGVGTMIIGIIAFFGGGAFIGWVIYRHIKYTIQGTKAHVEAVKEAVAGAKEDIKTANARKKEGKGWTLPGPDEK